MEQLGTQCMDGMCSCGWDDEVCCLVPSITMWVGQAYCYARDASCFSQSVSFLSSVALVVHGLDVVHL